MNSAETFVDILNPFDYSSTALNENGYQEKLVTWLSEAGMMEFFIFGSTAQNNGPKTIV